MPWRWATPWSTWPPASAHVTSWWSTLTREHSSALAVIGVALVAFPKLALGLSGFETGVLVMPQVADGTGTAEERLAAADCRDPGGCCRWRPASCCC